jgi:hypothetical protein
MAPHVNGKRRIDVIDLTDDHHPPSVSQSRKAPRSLVAGAFTQSQRDTWMVQDEEEDADDVIILSQDGHNSATESYELYGNMKLEACVLRDNEYAKLRHRCTDRQDCRRTVLQRTCD